MKLIAAPGLSYERQFWDNGCSRVAGLDEAGRGAWAGPVSAGAVILPSNNRISEKLSGVRDSKQMTPRQRAFWAEEIRKFALAWGVGFASNDEIDNLGILPATRLAMERALEKLYPPPQALLIDAVKLKSGNMPQQSIIRGDQLSLSISAASVLAKTERDSLMCALAEQYPGFSFEHHKGYGTKAHMAALEQHGVLDIHRKTYKPVGMILIKQSQGK